MNIDKQLLDNLSEQAKASPRLRMNYDLRTSPADTSQRMLNALEPGTVLPVHRHRTSTEVVVMLRGRAVQWLYDDAGNVTGNVELGEGGIPAMAVEKGQWHRLECLETGTVIFEAKDGVYEPIAPEDILQM
jgi:cupin fold WbuC family metalloprotein